MDWRSVLDRLLARRSDGQAPIHLGPRRIYILPSRAGLIYGLLLIAMLVGAINYGLALGHALVFLLAGVGLVAMVHTAANLWGIRVETHVPLPVFVGEAALFPLLLHNTKPRLRGDLHLAARGQPARQCHLAPLGNLRIDLPVSSKQRGQLSLPATEVSTRYPLGLFKAWSVLRPEVQGLVYPQPLFQPLPLGMGEDETSGHQGKQGTDDFAGLRERVPADPLKHIAWKHAARNDHSPLLIKQFAGGAREALMLDWHALPHLDTETRLSILTGWVLQAESGGHDYGLALPQLRIPLGRGTAHQHRCLEALALCPP